MKGLCELGAACSYRLRSGGPTAYRVLLVALVVAVSSCGGAEGQSGLPTPVLSYAEVEQLEAEASAFSESHMGVWPDVDAFVAHYAEEVDGADPTHHDFGPDSRRAAQIMWSAWERLTDYKIDVSGIYLSIDGAAYEESWPGLWPTDAGWPVPGPRDPSGPRALETYGFRDGLIVAADVWYAPEDDVRFGFGCFATDECLDLQETVDRYVRAWVSRDPGSIADLYSSDALFEDSLLGLEAQGNTAIANLADVRYGSTGELTFDVLGLYVWTDGNRPPTAARPQQGQIIGIAVHYLAILTSSTGNEATEGMVTLELGTMHVDSFDPDPNGLIHLETVYHEPSTLLERISR